jgi:hypothetical protein
MVAEELPMGEEIWVKEWRVTGRESTTFVCVSKNSIALELSQIQPVSLIFDLEYPVPADGVSEH